MNLNSLLALRADQDRPVRIGLIGAGKFGSMFLSQALHQRGFHVVGVCDVTPERARGALIGTGWPEERITRHSAAKALAAGQTFVTDDAERLIETGGLEVVIEATGNPELGIKHALMAFKRGRHVVMVNVEADVLAGPLLAKKAVEAGVVYTMAYGDQPALISEQVDWARTCGLEVVAAGKGTLYMPEFHASTPDTVWDHYGLTQERADASGMNPKMFNSFLDGTKSGIEMAAVANATGLRPALDGLNFPACEVEQIAQTLIPKSDGGLLERKGQVEVISSRTRDGNDLDRDLRWGVYVVFEAPTEYVKRCFADYGLITDETGKYSALWRPYHLIGLELGVSVAYAALLNLPTGQGRQFRGDVVATAKRDLQKGEELDGEGGFTVWGKCTPAETSLAAGAVPIGLAQNITLKRPLKAGTIVRWDDVEFDDKDGTYLFRREMEAQFAPKLPATKPVTTTSTTAKPTMTTGGIQQGQASASATVQAQAQSKPQGGAAPAHPTDVQTGANG